MAKMYSKKFEKELNKQINKLIEEETKKMIIEENKKRGVMNILSQNAESMLEVFINKYDGSDNYTVRGNSTEFPDRMHLSLNDTLNELKMNRYISYGQFYIGGDWHIILTPDGLEYFEKKGMRSELFEELTKSEKELLKNIIELDEKDEDIDNYVQNELEKDKKDIFRGILARLKSNGLINYFCYDDTIGNVKLLQSGRTYFEREEQYYKKMKKLSSNNTYNSITNSAVVFGNMIDSNINYNNSINNIEKDINERCNDEDKEELMEILNETREILENIKNSKYIEQRQSFFKKITKH